MRGIFTTGTDTGVGKTWIGVQLINELKSKGVDIIPRKPVESGWNQELPKTDAWQLANAANKINLLDEVCPNRFIQAISPARAAQNEGRNISIQQLVDQCSIKSETKDNFLYVEGAGGFYSPLADDGLNVDLAKSLNLPVLLVAENRLGCINQVLLNIEAINTANLSLVAVVLNQPKKLLDSDTNNLKENIEDLSSLTNVPVFPINYMSQQTLVFKEISELLLHVS